MSCERFGRTSSTIVDPMRRESRTAPVKEVVHDIIKGAVETERKFICEALPCDLIGMNADLMAQYIEFVADRLLCALGHSRLRVVW